MGVKAEQGLDSMQLGCQWGCWNPRGNAHHLSATNCTGWLELQLTQLLVVVLFDLALRQICVRLCNKIVSSLHWSAHLVTGWSKPNVLHSKIWRCDGACQNYKSHQARHSISGDGSSCWREISGGKAWRPEASLGMWEWEGTKLAGATTWMAHIPSSLSPSRSFPDNVNCCITRFTRAFLPVKLLIAWKQYTDTSHSSIAAYRGEVVSYPALKSHSYICGVHTFIQVVNLACNEDGVGIASLAVGQWSCLLVGRAWQTEFATYVPVRKGRAILSDPVYAAILQLPMQGILQKSGVLNFVLKRPPGQNPEWLQSKGNNDFRAALMTTAKEPNSQVWIHLSNLYPSKYYFKICTFADHTSASQQGDMYLISVRELLKLSMQVWLQKQQRRQITEQWLSEPGFFCRIAARPCNSCQGMLLIKLDTHHSLLPSLFQQ